MRNKTAIALIVCGLVTGVLFGDVWEDLAKYEYGDESKAGEQVEKLLQETPVKEYGGVEKKLMAVVASKEATQAGKAIACRMLQQVGTQQCIPAVSGLLGDKVLSHYARLVLERLKCAPANKAMRDALDGAPDKVKVGLLGSLGECRDSETVAPAAKLAKSSDPALAAAAIQALGKIGGKQAAQSLSSLRPDRKLLAVHMQAMVTCAGSLAGDEAAALCEVVLAGTYSPCRIAALRALASADASKASPLIAKAVASDDPMLCKGALGIVAGTKGKALTRAMLALLGDLPPARKAGLILALGSRGDTSALASLTELIRSDQPAVRDAAVKAVSKLGDAAAVTALLRLADSPALGASVVEAIARMTGDDIDGALAAALKDGKLRSVAIKASIARGSTAAVGPLLQLVKADDAATRKEAWAGLASLAGGGDMDGIMKAVIEIKDEGELPDATQAIRKVAARAEDKSKCFEVIAGYFDKATDATKGVILALAAVSGDSHALEMERKALASANKDLYGQALRALAAWPNESAAPDLLKLAKSGAGEVDRILALRGYIRIAGLETAKLSGAKRAEMFKTAMGLAERGEEKRQIVSGLQNAISIEALNMLKKQMDDPALRAEAQMSAATLIWHLRTSHPAEVTAMAAELMKSKNKTVVDKASKTVGDLNKGKAYVRAWLMSDVYTGASGGAVHKKAFGPETGDKDVKWSNLKKGIGSEVIDLDKALKLTDRCCVYAKTTLISPSEKPVRLELGSDDGIKAWLNGKLVHDLWAKRGCKPGQDVVKVTLKKGENLLMLKIVNESGHWAFSCRLRQENGMPVEGLQVRPR